MALRTQSYSVEEGGEDMISIPMLPGNSDGQAANVASFLQTHVNYVMLLEEVLAKEVGFMNGVLALCRDYLDASVDFIRDVADDPGRATLRYAAGVVAREAGTFVAQCRAAVASEHCLLHASPAEQSGINSTTGGRAAVCLASPSCLEAFSRYTEVYLDVVPALTRPPPIGGYPDWRTILRSPVDHLSTLARFIDKLSNLAEQLASLASGLPDLARISERFAHDATLLRQTLSALQHPWQGSSTTDLVLSTPRGGSRVVVKGSTSPGTPGAAGVPTVAVITTTGPEITPPGTPGAADPSAMSTLAKQVAGTPSPNLRNRGIGGGTLVPRGRGSRIRRATAAHQRRRRAKSAPTILIHQRSEANGLQVSGSAGRLRATAGKPSAVSSGGRTMQSVPIQRVGGKGGATAAAAQDPLHEMVVHDEVENPSMGEVIALAHAAVNHSRGIMSAAEASSGSAGSVKKEWSRIQAWAADIGVTLGDLLSFSPETLKRASGLKHYFREYYSEMFRYLRDRLSRDATTRGQLANASDVAQQMLAARPATPQDVAEASAFFKHFVTAARSFAASRAAETRHLRQRRLMPKLSGNRFVMLARLGQGSFGEVFLVRDLETDTPLAMKKIKRSALAAQGMSDTVETELAVLKGTGDSPWLVRLQHSFADPLHVYMFMDYVPGGDLESLLHSTDLEPEEARFYSAEVVASVGALHSLGYVHRDLKPDNFLIDSTGHLKLADFGLSKRGVREEHTSAFFNMVPFRVFTSGGSYKTMGARQWTLVSDVVTELHARLGQQEATDEESTRDEGDEHGLFTCILGTGELCADDRQLQPHETILGALHHGEPEPSTSPELGQAGRSPGMRSRSTSVARLLSRPLRKSGAPTHDGTGTGGSKAGKAGNAESHSFVFGKVGVCVAAIHDAANAGAGPLRSASGPTVMSSALNVSGLGPVAEMPSREPPRRTESAGSRLGLLGRGRSSSVTDSSKPASPAEAVARSSKSPSGSAASTPPLSPRADSRGRTTSGFNMPAASASSGRARWRRSLGGHAAASPGDSVASSFSELRAHLRRLRETDRTIAKSIVGTPYYMAPEMLAREGYTNAVDVWSVGCLIYEMHAGVPPFRGDTPEAVFSSIMDFKRTLDFDLMEDGCELFAPLARDVISKILVDSTQRLTLTEVQAHGFFDGTQWDDLHEAAPPFVPGSPDLPRGDAPDGLLHAQSRRIARRNSTKPIERDLTSVAADGDGPDSVPLVVGSKIEGMLVKRRRTALTGAGAKRWAALLSGALVFLHERSESAAREALRKPKSLAGATLYVCAKDGEEILVRRTLDLERADQQRATFDICFADGERYTFEATSAQAQHMWTLAVYESIRQLAERRAVELRNGKVKGSGLWSGNIDNLTAWSVRTYRRSKQDEAILE